MVNVTIAMKIATIQKSESAAVLNAAKKPARWGLGNYKNTAPPLQDVNKRY